MATDRKSRLVGLALLVLTLWPAVHLCLCFAYDLSPWKLAGWGMYAEPRLAPMALEVYGGRDGGSTNEPLPAPSAHLRQLASEFLERYRWLRRLTRPDDFAAAVFAEHPQWTRLRIELSRAVLPPESGIVEWEKRELYYDR